MDGRGRCHDNIFVERLWWTVKHEWVYYAQRPTASNRSAALASSSTGIICCVRIRRSAGEHRTRLTSANRRLRGHWPPDAMPRRCCEFVDSRLRRSPPDRASAVPYGQAGENATRFPHLAHRSAAAHKLHSTPQQDSMNLISGNRETSSRLSALAYSPRKLSKRPAPSQSAARLPGRQLGNRAQRASGNTHCHASHVRRLPCIVRDEHERPA